MVRLSFKEIVCGLGAVLLIGISSAAEAQLAGDLVQGTRVRVATHYSGTPIGTFEAITHDSIAMTFNGARRQYALNETSSVFQSAGHNRARGMVWTGLITGLLGTVAGGVIGSRAYKPCDPSKGFDCRYVPDSRTRATAFGATVFGVPSFIVGGLVGALRAEENWTLVRVR